MDWQTTILVGSAFVLVVGLVYYIQGQRGAAAKPVDGANRRKHARVKPEQKAPVRVQIIGEDFLDAFRANDISVGGLSVTVPHLFEGCKIDREVELIVTLPRKRAFQARGQIRHLRKVDYGAVFGVMFTAIETENRERINYYVETHADRIV